MLIPLISDYKLMSKSTLRTFEMYASMITETEYYVTLIDIAWGTFASATASAAGAMAWSRAAARSA